MTFSLDSRGNPIMDLFVDIWDQLECGIVGSGTHSAVMLHSQMCSDPTLNDQEPGPMHFLNLHTYDVFARFCGNPILAPFVHTWVHLKCGIAVSGTHSDVIWHTQMGSYT